MKTDKEMREIRYCNWITIEDEDIAETGCHGQMPLTMYEELEPNFCPYCGLEINVVEEE